jgi:hypothetical protein
MTMVHRGVPEKFLHKLGVDALTEQERGARVPEIVQTDVGKTRPLQERRERMLTKVRGVDRGPGLRSEDEALIAVEVSRPLYLR